MKYRLSFTEEMIMNPDPKYEGYTAGRIEVNSKSNTYAIDEIRFFANKPDFWKFREKWDWKKLSERGLRKFREKAEEYYDVP